MMVGMSKEMDKKREAIKSRLKKIGTDNPVVEKAMKKQDPDKAYEEFEVVHELVSAAMSKYSEEGGSLPKCFKDLADAIVKASKTASSKKEEDEEEDY